MYMYIGDCYNILQMVSEFQLYISPHFSVYCPAGQFIVVDATMPDSPYSCEVCPKDTYKTIDVTDIDDQNYYLEACTPCADDGTPGTLGNGSTSAADCLYGKIGERY